MTIYDLAEKIYNNGYKITIAPTNRYGEVLIKAEKGEREYTMPFALYPKFPDEEDMFNEAVKLSLYQVC